MGELVFFDFDYTLARTVENVMLWSPRGTNQYRNKKYILLNPKEYNVIKKANDEFIKDFKGQAPIMSYKERELTLLNCPYVDKVIPNFSGADSKPTILSVKPSIIAIGDDWAHKDYYTQMKFTQKWLDRNNIVLIYIPYTKSISTSEIIRRVKETRG